jgi:hypothetical protein
MRRRARRGMGGLGTAPGHADLGQVKQGRASKTTEERVDALEGRA